MVRFPERLLKAPEHVHDCQLELGVPEEARGVEHAGAFNRSSSVPWGGGSRPKDRGNEKKEKKMKNGQL